MEKNKNIYLVLTEYQFLQAINIATSTYSNKNYNNVIYVLRSGRRLMGIDAKKEWVLENIQIHILDNKNPLEIATIILKEKPEHFLIFQGNSALNVYLGYTLSKKGVKISLGPDGYGAYNIYKKKHPVLTLIKDTYIANYWLLKNKLFRGKIHRFDFYKYGNHKFINNILVTHPEQYTHQGNNKVNILRLPDFSEKCIDIVKKCFNFQDKFPIENEIYYFNQPLWPELIEKEFDFLTGVLANFPNNRIILKLHPLTSQKVKSMYQAVERLQIIESTVPAEVMLISLKNCIVFTGWSSVLITENKTCNYYFNYPIYKDSHVKLLNQSDLIVLDHITLVDKPDLMRFPDE